MAEGGSDGGSCVPNPLSKNSQFQMPALSVPLDIKSIIDMKTRLLCHSQAPTSHHADHEVPNQD